MLGFFFVSYFKSLCGITAAGTCISHVAIGFTPIPPPTTVIAWLQGLSAANAPTPTLSPGTSNFFTPVDARADVVNKVVQSRHSYLRLT